ncbi:hypothetical protein [Brevibacillus nitrificans]|uniref:hypothetical protein n=1 Tax=Brevibacillus nitrificans TaxID=651560 RepID=UPI002631C27C|nr:hypothetical protein [Brevibacillus nitrificans]
MEYPAVHQKFIEMGFERIEHTVTSTYRRPILCEKTGQVYPMFVTAVTFEHGQTVINYEEASFKESRIVPLSVRKAAYEKLIELEQRFLESPSTSVKQAKNGSMARNMEEIQKLGEEMKDLKTGSEIIDENKIPDPIQ